MRSIWKGNFVNIKKQYISKDSMVLNNFLRRKFIINNGKSNENVVITREMIGFKLGEFIFTRKMGVVHKKKKKNKMKKK